MTELRRRALSPRANGLPSGRHSPAFAGAGSPVVIPAKEGVKESWRFRLVRDSVCLFGGL